MKKIELELYGPYTILTETDDILNDCPYAGNPGLYIWAVKTLDCKFKVTYIGETSSSYYRRTKEHLIQIFGGNYQVCDADLLLKNQYAIIWNGLWRKGTTNQFPMFVSKYDELVPKIISFVKVQVLFLMPFDSSKEIRRRIESAIAEEILIDPEASSLMPHDIRYVKRKQNVDLISLHIKNATVVSGLPNNLLI